MTTSKRAQEALKRIYDRIGNESFCNSWIQSSMEIKTLKIIEDEYQKEGGDVNDLPGIK